jgi:hypothetical protein
VVAVVSERRHVVMGGMQGADALLLGRVSTRDSPRPGPTIRSRTIPVREEVRGVTHLDQLVPGLMGTPTEGPLVMDAPPERAHRWLRHRNPLTWLPVASPPGVKGAHPAVVIRRDEHVHQGAPPRAHASTGTQSENARRRSAESSHQRMVWSSARLVVRRRFGVITAKDPIFATRMTRTAWQHLRQMRSDPPVDARSRGFFSTVWSLGWASTNP